MARDRERTDLIIVHATGTPPQVRANMDSIHRAHLNKGIRSERGRTGYHFVIERSGEVVRGRELMEEGAHARGYNDRSVGICLIGGAKRKGSGGELVAVADYTDAQWAALERVVGEMQTRFPGSITAGHNTFSNTDCPSFDVEAWAHTKGFA